MGRGVEVLDANGALVGWIRNVGRRRRELVSVLGDRVGGIQRLAWGYGVEFAIADAAGRVVAGSSIRGG